MLSKILKIGNKLELTENVKIDGAVVKKNYHSQICDVIDEDNISVLIPVYEGKLIPLPEGKEYETYISTAAGMHMCKVRIVRRYKADNIYMMDLEIITEIVKFQRREFFRLDIGIEMMYKILTPVEVEEFVKNKVETESVRARGIKRAVTLDISGGGLRYVTKERNAKGQDVLIFLALEIGEQRKLYRILGKVLSSEIMNNRRDVFEERIEFAEISKEDRESIIKYIFEVERKRRQKERG